MRYAAADPPLFVLGHGYDVLARAVAAAPREATLVIQTPGVLAHIPWDARHVLIDDVRAAGRWITLDAPTLHRGWQVGAHAQEPSSDGFALALDGRIVAMADPLGSWLEWREGETSSPR
nr:DUF2332 family protein [Microbacterium hominis]